MFLSRVTTRLLVLATMLTSQFAVAQAPAPPAPLKVISVRYEGVAIRSPRWMGFTASGTQLVVRHAIPELWNDHLRVYDSKSGNKLAAVTIAGNRGSTPRFSHPVSLSADGDQLLYTQSNEVRFGALAELDPKSQTNGRSLGESRLVGPCFVWLTEKGDAAFVGSESAGLFTLEQWDLRKRTQRRLFQTGNAGAGGSVYSAATNVSAGCMAIAMYDEANRSTVECWTLSEKPTKKTIRPPNTAASVALSPDGKLVAVGFEIGAVNLYETDTGNLVRQVPRLGLFTVASIAFHPGGEYFVCGTNDKKGMPNLFAVNVTTGEVVTRVVADPMGVPYVCFSPKGDRFAAFCNSGEVRIWNAAALLKLERE